MSLNIVHDALRHKEEGSLVPHQDCGAKDSVSIYRCRFYIMHITKKYTLNQS